MKITKQAAFSDDCRFFLFELSRYLNGRVQDD